MIISNFLIPLNFPLGCGPGPDPLNFPLGCGPGGWSPWWRDLLGRGSPAQGGLLGRGSPWQGGVSLAGGIFLAGDIPACTEADPPPPVIRMTDRCKNITLATTSLRPVIKCHLVSIMFPGPLTIRMHYTTV